MSEISVMKNSRDMPTDLENVKINRSADMNCRMADYISQMNNPYLFKVGETVAVIEFSGTKDLSRMLTDIILAG